MQDVLFSALALMLVFEGLMPFLFPRAWRETFKRALMLTDGQLRFIGLMAMCLGLVLLGVIHALASDS